MRKVSEELFTCNVPTCRYRWEEAPTLISDETGRTIVTSVQLNHVTFFVIVIDTSEETGNSVLCQTGTYLLFRSCLIQPRHIRRDNLITLTRNTVVFCQLGIETDHHLEVMVIDGLRIVCINICSEVIFCISWLRDTAGSRRIACTTIPTYRIRFIVGIIRINWQDSPMVIICMRTHVTINIDSPILDWFQAQGKLLRVIILLLCLLSTILHLDQLHTFEKMSVIIINRTSRPTTGNIMEEETSHIGRTFVIFTCPFAGIIQSSPWR